MSSCSQVPDLSSLPPEARTSSGDVGPTPSEFSDRSARLDVIGQGIDAFRNSTRRIAERLYDLDDYGFDAALRLLTMGDGICGDVSPYDTPDDPTDPQAA